VVSITLVSLAILIFLSGFFRQKAKWIPLPLVVVGTGIGMSLLLSKISPGWMLKTTQIVNIPGNIFGEIAMPDFSKTFSNPRIFKDAFTIGLLASLETLLCVEAIDKLDPLKRKTSVNRELLAQGIGNMLCGLVGALPMTTVIVRGAANVDAGGRTRLSAFTHGIFLLLAVVLVPFVLNLIPYASLAAILMITGYNLTKPGTYRQMFRLGWNQFLPFVITIAVILATDLLEGVIIGLVISIYFIVRNNFKAEYKIEHHRESATEHYYIKLNSMVTFLNKMRLQKTLYQVPPYSVLTIDGTDSRFVDYDVLEMISEYEKQAHEKHIQLVLKHIERVNVSALH
jgi:MFS superfamily sulfate permease-like transporter